MITLADLLQDKQLKKDFEEVDFNNPVPTGETLEEAFEKEIRRLWADASDHPWDCKCLIHV